jgi:hypothetical protein
MDSWILFAGLGVFALLAAGVAFTFMEFQRLERR